MKKNEIKVLCLINGALALLFAIGAYLVIPGFEELFNSFGADLPLATVVLLQTYRYWIALIIIPIMAYVLCSQDAPEKPQTGLWFTSVALLAFYILLFPAVVVVLYLPIFKLGSVV